jgi:hypothetical protein
LDPFPYSPYPSLGLTSGAVWRAACYQGVEASSWSFHTARDEQNGPYPPPLVQHSDRLPIHTYQLSVPSKHRPLGIFRYSSGILQLIIVTQRHEQVRLAVPSVSLLPDHTVVILVFGPPNGRASWPRLAFPPSSGQAPIATAQSDSFCSVSHTRPNRERNGQEFGNWPRSSDTIFIVRRDPCSDEF